MSTVEISQADLLREWIEKKISENYDYSKSSYKKNDIKQFIKEHPELDTTESKVSNHHRKILKEIGLQQGKQPSEIGIKKPKVNPSMINSDMQATIEARPQSEILVGATSQVIQPQIAGQQQQLQNPMSTNKGNHSPEFVSASINALYLGIRMIVAPLAELMSEQELKVLGEQGKPIFDRFFGENEDLVMSFMGIGGVIVPKLIKGRRLKNEKEGKEESETSKDFKDRLESRNEK